MDILFCGTAAAEGWPALFCTCEACLRARAGGGRSVRTRAATMVGERVRIDFGPDSYLHQCRHGLAYERLEHLLVTHSHADHWFPEDLAYRRNGFSRVPEAPLHVWGNEAVERRFVEANGSDWAQYRLEFERVEPWRAIALGGGLTATPVPAAHDRSEVCVNYLLELGGRAALIAHDTGWYDEATWDALAGRPLNIAAIDCTYGSWDHAHNHLGCAAVVRFRDELARRGSLAPDATVVATHFSHNGGWLPEELERYFSPHGIGVAYDGLAIPL